MSETFAPLHVQVGGRDLLIATADLREVIAPAPISPLPGGPPGIKGVIIHQGEFLPVLAWKDLPGCPDPIGIPEALAVLRPRLGLPLDRLWGTVEVLDAPWPPVPADDPWQGLLAGFCPVGGRALPLLDVDRLIALLQRLRVER